jgi:hypothetical protein
MSLLSNCGLEGIGMYWILIEILHQQPESKIEYQVYSDFIDFYGRINCENEQMLNKLKQMLIQIGLFVNQDNFIFSNRVLENKKQRKEISDKRSLAGKKSAEIRQKITSDEQNLTNVEQDINKGQLGKEKKGKEMKDNIINNSEETSPKVNNLQELYKTMGLPKQATRSVKLWQDEASNCVKYFTDGESKRSSIFKCFKDNQSKARTAFSDCKELEKKSVLYFLKVFNEIKKPL